MADLSRIFLDPHVLAGKPVVRGARLSIEFVLGLPADGGVMPGHPLGSAAARPKVFWAPCVSRDGVGGQGLR
jgi:hypothetical protein